MPVREEHANSSPWVLLSNLINIQRHYTKRHGVRQPAEMRDATVNGRTATAKNGRVKSSD
ncbi:hypothetical protein AERO8C_30114 [Aeromonas veronii]|uniref:Uncharacterized protein n=1 Tax=Aeromonas veronii TaxID=654 RepID=A0A653L686_AERVE|nr:hypothetical protein AERO8C_30114 [Aeromonas veronii]